ncbi:MAG: glycosyltransferase family 2 protein [Isosphaeraceae bacterium]|nr:glycosyltransferase family 2 protein [Isosphaeraceae bacterium]
MDDFPAGPASPGPRRPPLSVVIPVRDGGRDFERCLRGLRDSSWTDYELVVVDDGSTDGSGALAAAFGARVVRHDQPRGPAAARNAGAEAAAAPLVFFLDADVAPHPDTLARALAHFEADPGLAALFGSYDDQPAAPGLVSQYRNLLHHYVHQQGSFNGNTRPVHTFWTGCGAIRRRVFLDLGGFDPHLYRRPAIEDIELGYRMTQAGHRIVLARDVQATHWKRWTLLQVLRTDLCQRGIPWMLAILRARMVETDLNVSPSQRLCVAATGLGVLGLLAAPWFPMALALTLANLAVVAVWNRDFYRFLARRRGWGFALGAFPLHYLYFCCCGLSVVIALAIWYLWLRYQTRPRGASRSARLRARADAPDHPAPQSARPRRPSRWTQP